MRAWCKETKTLLYRRQITYETCKGKGQGDRNYSHQAGDCHGLEGNEQVNGEPEGKGEMK